jgi:D-arabinose 1-dehydrogenase-like Zn-dependent alcohol dehydrogenase
VKSDLIIGHEAVGRMHALGGPVNGYNIGDRVLVGAITPCGQCEYCLDGKSLPVWRTNLWLETRQHYQWCSSRMCNGDINSAAARNPHRLQKAIQIGADHTVDIRGQDAVAEILRREALGFQETFENALRGLKAGGTLSSLGVYSGKLTIPSDGFAAGLGDHTIVTTLCSGKGTYAETYGTGPPSSD